MAKKNVEDLDASLKKLDVAEKEVEKNDEVLATSMKKLDVAEEKAEKNDEDLAASMEELDVAEKKPEKDEVTSKKEPKKQKGQSMKAKLVPQVPRVLDDDIIYYDGSQKLEGTDKMTVFIKPYEEEKLSLEYWQDKFVKDYRETVKQSKDKPITYENYERETVFQPNFPKEVIDVFNKGPFKHIKRKIPYWKELSYVYIKTMKLVMENFEVMNKYKRRDMKEESKHNGDNEQIFITAGMFGRNINHTLCKLVLDLAASLRELFRRANLSITVITITQRLVNYMDPKQGGFCNRKADELFSITDKKCIIVKKMNLLKAAIIQARTSPHKILYIFLECVYKANELQGVKEAEDSGHNDQIKEEEESEDDQEYEEEGNADSNT